MAMRENANNKFERKIYEMKGNENKKLETSKHQCCFFLAKNEPITKKW